MAKYVRDSSQQKDLLSLRDRPLQIPTSNTTLFPAAKSGEFSTDLLDSHQRLSPASRVEISRRKSRRGPQHTDGSASEKASHTDE